MTTASNMLISGVVIETTPGKAESVAARIAGTPGLVLVGGDDCSRLAGVLESPDPSALERALRELVRRDEEILGVYPTFLGREDETDEQ